MESKIKSRKSLRLPHYDYSQAGFYFVTICCQNKKILFGKVVGDEAQLNPAGEMIAKWYYKLETKFPGIRCREMIVMPNHFHCIIEIKHTASVGADPRVCPDFKPKDAHMGAPLPEVVHWFKTMTTNDYIRGVKDLNWPRFDKKLWQRNYYEHIIRSENSYLTISEYIQTNAIKWQKDKYYTP